MTKEVDESIIGMLWWFRHVESMENDRIAKRMYVGECTGNKQSVGQLQKRWIDAMKNCFKKKKRFGYDASNENGGDL